jgi:hypothetical protein
MKISLPICSEVEFEGKKFYNEKSFVAFEKAIEYAGEKGRVLSLPELIKWRINSDFDSESWINWYTANSEENIGKTPQENSAVLIIHGGGILTPKRIENAINDGLINSAAQYTQKEFSDALEGKMPDNSEIPIYSLEEFKKNNSQNLPIRYGIVMDLKNANSLKSGIYPIDTLRNNDLVIARCGGEETANNYLDKLIYEGYTKIGNWHRFENVNTEKPSGLLLFLGGLIGYDFGGGFNLCNFARFVVVKEKKPYQSLLFPPKKDLKCKIQKILQETEVSEKFNKKLLDELKKE